MLLFDFDARLMAVHENVPVEKTSDVGAADGGDSFAGGVAETKTTVADAELVVRQVQVLATLAVVLVLRGTVEDGAHVFEVAFAGLDRLEQL